ncbi:MAG: DUF4384 domain-containing protein [Deltaproteobacteria bacterium]|nr:DUF4384 domain-containing protein [Deltaproteobacteria bacterium]
MKGFVVALCLGLLLPLAAVAADQPLWVEATGEAQMGEMETLREVRDRARRDAESKAVETAVGTFIKSHTLVSNSQVAEDLIYAAVRGKIAQETVLSADWDARERTLYRVKLRALVEPIYPEKGQGLAVQLTLSRTDLKEGDEVRIFYQVSEPAYVYIFSVAADGSVTLLLPNAAQPDNLTPPGKPCQFPPADGRLRLTATFLPGYKEAVAEERIKVIATRKKEELLSVGFREGVFQVFDAESTGMVSDLARRLNRIELADWTEATATYLLKRRD